MSVRTAWRFPLGRIMIWCTTYFALTVKRTFVLRFGTRAKERRDLSLGERMDHHQVKRSLVFGDLPFIVRMLDGKEVFIKRNVEFCSKDLLRVKRVVVPKRLQNFSGLITNALHQGVEYFEVPGAPRSDEVVDVACQDLVDFNPSCCRL